ncbi:hypothetical protein K469DRAFT_552368, partial [Zopfia rhizophila CBS 207.26]
RLFLALRIHSHHLHVRAKAKLQRDRLLSGPLVDVYIGESKRHWALHRNLLCHHSEQLESELQPEGKKKQEKLELRDHDPAGFELLVKWLYQGRLDDVSDMADPNQKYEYAVSCHKLYLLCDRFDMPQLKNVAMDQYRKGLNEAQLVPDAEEINEIYRKSPSGSPFRRLMTKIAARQIMDPESERNVETYRECFKENPNFAVDLVDAIKLGTGGMLFNDPTFGNECEYHDHETGPNCHIKGKGRKQARLRPVPKSAKSDPSANPDPRPLHHPPPPTTPNPPPRQARRHPNAVGPLRRCLTSPASSTVDISTENATATPPSPTEQRDKFRQVTSPEKRFPSPTLGERSVHLPTVQDEPHLSSGGEFRQPLYSSTSDESNKADNLKAALEDTSPRRGIWEWARVGTGRLGIIGRIPHPEWKAPTITSKVANSAVNGDFEEERIIEEFQDDFSVPSTVSTESENSVLRNKPAAAKLEGREISNSTVDPSMFAQTKRSSDDLVANASGDTPSPTPAKKDAPFKDGSEETQPSTPDQKIKLANGPPDTPSPTRIPKYKIALASSILSPISTKTATT